MNTSFYKRERKTRQTENSVTYLRPSENRDLQALKSGETGE